MLFALFYVGVEALGRPAARERVLTSVLLGGLALAGLMVAQHLFLGYDRLDRRPSGFLGHYMSASGVTMAVLLLAVARLALGPRARPGWSTCGCPRRARRAWRWSRRRPWRGRASSRRG